MAKVISQETFNDIVNENAAIFDLSLQDAIAETVKQFRSQGVELSNIIIDVNFIEGHDILQTALEQIDVSMNTGTVDFDVNYLVDCLNAMKPLLSENIAYRMHMASALNGFARLFNLMKASNKNTKLLTGSFDVMRLLLKGYPDLVTQEFAEYLINELDSQVETSLTCAMLGVLKNSSVMHEANRQTYFDLGVDKKLQQLLTPESDPLVIFNVCSCVVALSADDDVRVTVSASHKICCALANVLVTPMIEILKENTVNVNVIISIFNALRVLMVRNEICEKVTSMGGVSHIIIILCQHPTNEAILGKGFTALCALAGNDDVRDEIISRGIAAIIVGALDRFIASKKLCLSALTLISKLSMRNKKFPGDFHEEDGLRLLMQAMAQHSDDEKLQMYANWCIRNIVSREPSLIAPLLLLDAKRLIRKSYARFPSIKEDCKAALRDLKQEVEFTERWTGEEGDKLKHD